MNAFYCGLQTADIWSCGVFLYVMMVGSYPFERPEDKKKPDKLRRMIQRIVNVEYTIPSWVRMSEDCRDILSNILVKDLKRRLTMDQLQQHRWFRKNLPEGAQDMNKRLQQQGAGLQSIESIARIVDMAKTKEKVKDDDSLIDDELANLDDES